MAIVTFPTRNDLREYRQQVRLDGVLFTFLIRYNSRDDSWYFDLLDSSDVVIRSGIRVRVGTPMLFRIATSGRPAGELIPIDTTGADTEPGLEEFSGAVPLLYIEAADLAAL